jgi:multidrug resistance protein, MATE family
MRGSDAGQIVAETHAPRGWWSRPCGGREVFLLAIPLVVSTGSWTVMNFIDRMFLLWHSTDAMAAAMPAGMLHFALLCLPLGIASYVNTFVAQYHGAGRPERIGPAVWQGVRLGLLCVPLYLLLIPLAPWFFHVVGHKPELANLEAIYFRTVAFAAGGEVIAAALSAFFTGLGVNRVVMVVDSLASLMNIVLDYGWIFGHFGLPALGIEGAALATVVSLWFRVVAYAVWMMRPKYRRPYHLWTGRAFDVPLFRRLLQYGGPNGLQLLVDVAGFTVFLLLVGNLGPEAMAATTLAFNVNAMAFVPMLGLGIALTTLVGRQLGHNRPDLAARATWTSLWMAEIYMGTMAAFYVLLPDVLLWGHAAGTTPEQFDQLRVTTIILLRFVATYCLFDALNVVFAATLKGAGDTRFILVALLAISPASVAIVWAGIRYGQWGLMSCWVVITIWVSALGLAFFARFLHGGWRHMRVIEPELLL